MSPLISVWNLMLSIVLWYDKPKKYMQVHLMRWWRIWVTSRLSFNSVQYSSVQYSYQFISRKRKNQGSIIYLYLYIRLSINKPFLFPFSSLSYWLKYNQQVFISLPSVLSMCRRLLPCRAIFSAFLAVDCYPFSLSYSCTLLHYMN